MMSGFCSVLSSGIHPFSVFSTTFRYGLISLLELAESQALLQAGVIASKHHLSLHYLSVVLADLRRLGLVESHKGKKGGYRLACEPRQVNLLDLYHSLAGSSGAESVRLPDRGRHPERERGPGEQQADQALRASGSAADLWLEQVCQRWSDELAATSLADLQVLNPAG